MEPQGTMEQAPKTIDFYLSEAKKSIDILFGEGFAKANPELVAAYVGACVADYSACRKEDALNELCKSIDRISDSIGNLKID